MDSNGFDTKEIDRNALLDQAAQELNALYAHMGDTKRGATPPETPEAISVRSLKNDKAEFGAFPEVYKINDQDFQACNVAVPIRFQQLAQDYKFYWMRLPIILVAPENWPYNRLRVEVKMISADSPPHAQPRAYQILPTKKFQTLMEIDGRLEVSLDPNFEFNARVETIQGDIGFAEASVGGGVGAKLKSNVGFIVGPFAYRVKKAQIDHNALGTEFVHWMIDGAAFFQDYDLDMIIIIQVPRANKQVQLDAAMSAYRYFAFAPVGIQRNIEQFSQAIIQLFKGGTPISDERTWDLTPRLIELDGE